MNSLDDLLFSQIPAQLHKRMENVLDFNTWNLDNRDSKLDEVRECARQIASETNNFVHELVTTTNNNQTLLYWRVLLAFITAERDFLTDLRSQFDYLTDTDLHKQPITYEWLTEQIRLRITEIANLNLASTDQINESSIDEL